jgi:hypothetical protein
VGLNKCRNRMELSPAGQMQDAMSMWEPLRSAWGAKTSGFNFRGSGKPRARIDF